MIQSVHITGRGCDGALTEITTKHGVSSLEGRSYIHHSHGPDRSSLQDGPRKVTIAFSGREFKLQHYVLKIIMQSADLWKWGANITLRV